MALSSTLKATIALLIIVVVVTVVVVVVVVVVAVVVVVVVTVVVVVVVYGCWLVVVVVTIVVVLLFCLLLLLPYPTVSGQMANPIAVTTPRPGPCSASYSVGFDCSWKDHHSVYFSFFADVQHRLGNPHEITFPILSTLSGNILEHIKARFICHHFLQCLPMQWHDADSSIVVFNMAFPPIFNFLDLSESTDSLSAFKVQRFISRIQSKSTRGSSLGALVLNIAIVAILTPVVLLQPLQQQSLCGTSPGVESSLSVCLYSSQGMNNLLLSSCDQQLFNSLISFRLCDGSSRISCPKTSSWSSQRAAAELSPTHTGNQCETINPIRGGRLPPGSVSLYSVGIEVRKLMSRLGGGASGLVGEYDGWW
ncbi:hypothetical protein Tco_1420037 [Tanacetum coccineum]